jgi:hypothetical protein
VAAATWAIGEYAELLEDPVDSVNVLIDYPTSQIDGSAQVALITAAMKIYAASSEGQAAAVFQRLKQRLEVDIMSDVAEVHERACLFVELLTHGEPARNATLKPLFEGKLLPVDHRLQREVPVPEGLDLNTSLLDTGGLTLHAYIADGEESYVTDDAAGGPDVDDDDDLFRQLKSGPGMFGQRLAGKPANGESSGSKTARENSLFYLGDGELHGPDDPTAKESDPNELMQTESRASPEDGFDDLTALSRGRTEDSVMLSNPVTVYTGEQTAPGMNVYDGGMQTPSARHFRSGDGVGNERLNAAFDGVFRSNQAPETEKKKRRRKKSSKSKQRAAKETGENLIDFDDSAPSHPAPSGPLVSQSAPKHMGPQSDLLL